MADVIQKFFKDKTLFITGGTGFMGKVLLEKLLYSCSDLKEILILVRPKKGKTGEQRVQEFAQVPVSFLPIDVPTEVSFLLSGFPSHRK